VYFASDISRGGGGGPTWRIKNPHTGQYVTTPARGWAFSKKEDLLQAIKEDRIHFSGKSVPCYKRYLKENESTILDTIFYKDRRAASLKFRDMMGDGVFDFPKDHEIIGYFIKALTPQEAVILDFFAGSGTTGHSVLELNKNGSKRQFILSTNNEGGICTDICHPRLKKVVKGYKGVKSGTVFKGLPGNLKYFRTAFVKLTRNKDQMAVDITRSCTEMLCLKEGIYALRKEAPDWKLFEQGTRYMGVYYNFTSESLSHLRDEMNKLTGDKVLYCFTVDPEGLDPAEFRKWKDVRLEPIPQKILDVYKRIFEGHK
jgi:hypothetical protein